MNILLIAPASGKWRRIGRSRIFNGKTFRFSLLSLLSVSAETPAGHTVRIIDEQFDEIPWDTPVDLIGITCMTALAPRAYALADSFRGQGVPVVLGGMHPTFCAEEALQHADAVVAGEAEGIWPVVLEDALKKEMHGIYRAAGLNDLTGLKSIPFHLLKTGRYSTYPIQATRGCPHQCSFCSVSAFHHGVQRQRPIARIIEEIAAIPSRHFIFIDDNLTADVNYAEELFRALIPLGKTWITQSSLEIVQNLSLVELASQAGCAGLFVGLETFSDRNLNAVNKGINRVDRYREAVQILHAHGIGVEAGIVFGFDGDAPEVFEETLYHLDDLQIDMAQVSIFTPLPGTSQMQSMNARILDRHWDHYDFHHAVHEPLGMAAEDLQAGHDWVTREFYHPRRIAMRLARHVRRPHAWRSLPFAVAINAAYYGRVVRWNIQGWNPARESVGRQSKIELAVREKWAA